MDGIFIFNLVMLISCALVMPSLVIVNCYYRISFAPDLLTAVFTSIPCFLIDIKFYRPVLIPFRRSIRLTAAPLPVDCLLRQSGADTFNSPDETWQILRYMRRKIHGCGLPKTHMPDRSINISTSLWVVYI